MKNRQNFRLEDRVLFEAGAALEAAAAEQTAQDMAAAAAEAAKANENKDDSGSWDGVTESEAAGSESDQPVAAGSAEPDAGSDVISYAEAPIADGGAVTAEKKLVVVNSSVADAGKIVNDLNPDEYEVLYLTKGRDALDEINAYLDEHADTKYSALHIVSHGNDGYFTLNGEKIDNSTLNPADWKNIGEHLTDGADILLYGCDTAKSENGKALVNQIASLTGADVTASTDATGKSGNWDLEYASGEINAKFLAPAGYNYDLESLIVSITAEIGEDENGSVYILSANVSGGADGITYTYSWTLGDDSTVLGTEQTLTVSKADAGLYKVAVTQVVDDATTNDGTGQLNVITVDDNEGSAVADDGKTQFHEAVAAANSSADPSFIGFNLAEDSRTITLDSPLTLTKSITISGDIDGDGKADVTVSGGGTTQIFSSIDTTGGQTYVFEDIVFDKAYSSAGGAVMQFVTNITPNKTDSGLPAVNVTLDGVTISNSVSGKGLGGAISSRTYYASSSDTEGVDNVNWVFRDSIFFNNTGGSAGAVMNIGRGGSVSVGGRDGTVLIERCLFDSNKSTHTDGGIVTLYSIASATVTDSAFISNTSTGSKAQGVITANNSRLLVANSTLAYNTVTYGVLLGGADSSICTVNSVYSRNTVTNATYGAVIVGYNTSTSTFSTARIIAANSVFLDNTVAGGKILNNSTPDYLSRLAYYVVYNNGLKLNHLNGSAHNQSLAGSMSEYYYCPHTGSGDHVHQIDGTALFLWDGNADTAAAHLASIVDPRMYFTPKDGSIINSAGTQVAANVSGTGTPVVYVKDGNVWKTFSATSAVTPYDALPDEHAHLLLTKGITGDPISHVSDEGETYYAVGNYGVALPPQETPGLVVTTGSDLVNNFDNVTSLREALAYAAERAAAELAENGTVSTYTITFDSAVFNSAENCIVSLFADSGALTIADNVFASGLIIDGSLAGGLHMTIDGTNMSGSYMLTVNSGNAVTLQNLTFQNAQSGAVQNKGTMNIVNSTFSGNSGSRGAVYNNAGTLNVINSTFSGNKSVNDSSIGNNSGSGGALYNAGSAVLLNSIFVGNTAAKGGADIYGYSGTSTTSIKAYYSVIGEVDRRNAAATFTKGVGTKVSSVKFDENMVGDDVTVENTFASVTDGKAVLDADGTFKLADSSWAAARGAFVWHSDDWSAIAYSTTIDGSKTKVTGTLGNATEMLATDSTGAAISGDTASMGAVYVGTTQLGVTATAGDAVEYGSGNVTLTATATGGSGIYTYEWILDGQTVATTTEKTYTISNVDQSGTYTVRVIDTWGNAASDTAVATVTAYTGEIVVTITGNSSKVTYTGLEQSISGYSVSTGNNLYTESDFTFSGAAYAAGTNAGTYGMNLAAEQFTNISRNFTNVKFEVSDGVLSIGKAALVISALNQTITYGQDFDATKVSYEGFVNGETSAVLSKLPAVTSTYTKGANAGSYNLTAGGAAAANYEISYSEEPGILTVEKAALDIAGLEINGTAYSEYKFSKVYDGVRTYDTTGLSFTINGVDVIRAVTGVVF